MKTALITRIKSLKEDEIRDFEDWLNVFNSDKRIANIYIISLRDEEIEKLSINRDKIKSIVSDEPTSPTSINLAISELKNDIDYFIVASKEVGVTEKKLDNLITEIENSKKYKLLVTGYKFKIVDKNGKLDKKLNNELQDYYKNDDLIAYKVPWNTCAIWNRKLFKKVEKFDEITAKNPFPDVYVCIDNVCSLTPHQGMEDGLAIAEAVNKNKNLKFKLLDDYLSWEVNVGKEENHREKLARKETVLRNFMRVRNYYVDDLKAAEMQASSS